MFGGSPLNRLSWLRSSHSFLNAVIVSPATRWVLFNAGRPLVISKHDMPSKHVLAHLTTTDVKPLLGSEPFFGQGKDEGQLVSSAEKIPSLEAARHRNIPVVFLGLQELHSTSSALPSSDFIDPHAAVANLQGTPFFAMDVADSDIGEERIDAVLKASSLSSGGELLSWAEPRVLITGLDRFAGAVFAVARSMVDWNQRNKFCPACGSPNYSLWGGWKLSCSSLLPWTDLTNRKPCPTAKGLHNFTHPRTDAVVIMIAIDETGERIFLGRNKNFPRKMYSALAGFIEPGETFEDAVLREMWEEAGLRAWDVRYHSGQPWPYPANLMVGFYTRADASQPIRVDLDNELEDARWFTRSEIRSVLAHTLAAPDYKEVTERTDGKDNLRNPSQGAGHGAGALAHSDPSIQAEAPMANQPVPGVNQPADEPSFKLPPVAAIAGLLIRDWADGKIGYDSVLKKGNL